MKKREKIAKEEKTLWYKGYNYFLKGEYEKAKKFYIDAINKEHDGSGYLMLGILYDKLKKYDDAIEHFNKYAEFSDRTKSIAYGYRGATKLKLGLYNDAFEDFMLAIKTRVEIKKIEQNNDLNTLSKILGTYKQANLNNQENKISGLNKKIDKCFSNCISCIDFNNFEEAIEYLQDLLKLYSENIVKKQGNENDKRKN